MYFAYPFRGSVIRVSHAYSHGLEIFACLFGWSHLSTYELLFSFMHSYLSHFPHSASVLQMIFSGVTSIVAVAAVTPFFLVSLVPLGKCDKCYCALVYVWRGLCVFVINCVRKYLRSSSLYSIFVPSSAKVLFTILAGATAPRVCHQVTNFRSVFWYAFVPALCTLHSALCTKYTSAQGTCSLLSMGTHTRTHAHTDTHTYAPHAHTQYAHPQVTNPPPPQKPWTEWWRSGTTRDRVISRD